MQTELYDIVRESIRSEFDLLADLEGHDGWRGYLARDLRSGGLAVLLLEEVPADGGGELDLQVLRTLDAAPVGFSTCHACGTETEGWPRHCGRCGRDLASSVSAADAAELLEEVQSAAEDEYEILGSMPHAEGGSEVYFARELDTGRVVGLALVSEAGAAGDELSLAVAWTPDDEGATHEPAWTPGPAVAKPDATAQFATPPSVLEWPDATAVPLAPPPAPLFPRRRRTEGPRLALYAGGALVVLALALLSYPVFSGGNEEVDPAEKSAAGPATEPSGPEIPIPTPDLDTTAGGAEQTTYVSPAPTPPQPEPVPQPEPKSKPPAPEPVPGPVASDAELVASVLARYAAAVESGQTSRIQRAYPGITLAEIDRWERLFESLGAESGLSASYSIVQGPDIQANVADVRFTLSLSYLDATGQRVRQPLPLRGILERDGAGWRLQEVRSLR